MVGNCICVPILNPVFKSFRNLMFSTMFVLVSPRMNRCGLCNCQVMVNYVWKLKLRKVLLGSIDTKWSLLTIEKLTLILYQFWVSDANVMATVMCAKRKEAKTVTVKITPSLRAVRVAKIPKYHVINCRLLLNILNNISRCVKY